MNGHHNAIIENYLTQKAGFKLIGKNYQKSIYVKGIEYNIIVEIEGTQKDKIGVHMIYDTECRVFLRDFAWNWESLFRRFNNVYQDHAL